jgi:hypothetical protein
MISILSLHRAPGNDGYEGKWLLPVIAYAFVASFSFGTGLAVWPALLFLGWSIRLSWRSLAILCAGGFIAGSIYYFLPGDSGSSNTFATGLSLFSAFSRFLHDLCMLVGSPFLHGQVAWSGTKVSREAAGVSQWAAWPGALGVACAGFVIIPRILRKDLSRKPSQLVAAGLVSFSIFVMAIIVLGRASHFRVQPFEVAAPRYLFWSSLFWTGLLLASVLAASSRKWLRWSVFCVTVALPILAYPSHYREGLHWRHGQYLAEGAATSLINDVRDEMRVRILFREPQQVFSLGAEFRKRRLDMFAAGLQDWLGQREANLYDGRRSAVRFRGTCRVDSLVQDSNGSVAARVTGRGFKGEDDVPRALALIDDDGLVCGIARSWVTGKLVNRVFYGGRFWRNDFVGYIRDYDPERRYFVRSADDASLSDERISVDVR